MLWLYCDLSDEAYEACKAQLNEANEEAENYLKQLRREWRESDLKVSVAAFISRC